MQVRSLTTLRVFDAVARSLNFSRAAAQLAMSQGAISYQIKRLEDELGFSLFDRGGRAVRLTAAGAEFHSVTVRLLDELDQAAFRLRRRARPELVIGVSTYFGSRWLSPRLMRFMAQHPAVMLRLQPMVAQPRLDGTGVDVAIVWGSDDAFAGKYDFLLESRVTPMCGGEVARTLDPARPDEWLNTVTLIHEDETREAWQTWLAAASLPDGRGRRGPIIPDPNMRVQALIDGQGVALVDHLVDDEVARGRLVAPFDLRLGGFGYYIVVSDEVADRADIRSLVTWLKQEAGVAA